MVKENKLKLIGSTVTSIRTIPKTKSTTIFSILISIAIIASISAIGITSAYMLSHSTEISGKCIKNMLPVKQTASYANQKNIMWHLLIVLNNRKENKVENV